jgi:hypothetical protein
MGAHDLALPLYDDMLSRVPPSSDTVHYWVQAALGYLAAGQVQHACDLYYEAVSIVRQVPTTARDTSLPLVCKGPD